MHGKKYEKKMSWGTLKMFILSVMGNNFSHLTF